MCAIFILCSLPPFSWIQHDYFDASQLLYYGSGVYTGDEAVGVVDNHDGLCKLPCAHRSSYGSRTCFLTATQGLTPIPLQERSIKSINLIAFSTRHTRSSLHPVIPTWPPTLLNVSFDINIYLAQLTQNPLDFITNFFRSTLASGPSTYVTLLVRLHRAANSLHQSSARRG
jgi:hypothetical protein